MFRTSTLGLTDACRQRRRSWQTQVVQRRRELASKRPPSLECARGFSQTLQRRSHRPDPVSSNTHTYTHPFKGPFSRTTRVSRYQKGKTNLDFTEARDNEWQWHQLGHMEVCNLLQTDNHTSTPPLIFYRLNALPAVQPTASHSAATTAI